MQVQAPSAPSKWLLVAMANVARPPAYKVFGSAATFAAITHLDRKTVLSSTIALEVAGLIRRTEQKAGRGGARVFTLPVVVATDPENGSGSDEIDEATSTENGIGSAESPVRTEPENGLSSSETSTENGSGSESPDGAKTPNRTRFSREPIPKTGHIYSTEEKKSMRRSAPAPTALELLPEVDAQTLADWEVVRKAKRAGPITETVAKSLRKQAAQAGLAPQSAVEFCCERGWQGFNAGWYANAMNGDRRGAGAPPQPATGDLWSGAK